MRNERIREYIYSLVEAKEHYRTMAFKIDPSISTCENVSQRSIHISGYESLLKVASAFDCIVEEKPHDEIFDIAFFEIPCGYKIFALRDKKTETTEGETQIG